MASFQPITVNPPETSPDDLRIGHLLQKGPDQNREPWIVLLGFPSDEGVRINGGRPGAAQAPDRIREMLYRLTPDPHEWDLFTGLLENTLDLGDLPLGETVEESQEALGVVLTYYIERGIVPIILGGGHETSFGHFLGYEKAKKNVEIINWDAHADVRPLINERAHSGSPFRQALLHPSGACRKYTVGGILPHSVAKEHLLFIQNYGGVVVWKDELTPEEIIHLYSRAQSPCLVTFDLDVVDQVWAPGVSAPATSGISPGLWYHAARQAGRSPNVTSIDIVEMNPSFDIDGRTARLAALTVWHFMSGFIQRIQNKL